MTQISRQYNVVNKFGFVEKMKELTRRYKVEFEVVWGKPYDQLVEFTISEPMRVFYHPCTVTFSFEEFKIDGYQYLGNILDNDMVGLITIHGNDLTEGMDLSSWVKEFESIPCHACNRKHVRKIGHLFQNLETGELEIFGSGCAKKYFGINFDRVLGFFTKIEKRFEEWDDVASFASRYVNSDVCVKDAYYIISKYGYTSKSKAMDFYSSTAYKLQDFRTGMGRSNEYVEITKDIDSSLVWTTNHTKDSDNKTDFEHNIEVLQEKLSYNLCSEQDYGWIAFLVWNQFFKPAPVEKKEYVLPELEVGDKIEKVEVVLTNITWFDNQWGRTYINTFENGNVRYKWFSSVNVATKFDIETDTLPVKLFINKATVKELKDDPKFGKAVHITRASVYEI